jgi:hypothetical protein
MQTYEIRVLKDHSRSTAIIAQRYISDHAALRAAQHFAQGHRFEVWRGIDCIYGAYTDRSGRAVSIDAL